MTGSSTDGSGIVGQQTLNDPEHPYNTTDQFINQALGRIATIRLVKVIGVDEVGGLGPVGFVDVQMMVNLVDGLLGSSMKHGQVFHIPYFRLQGGKCAIIMDPKVGDIGFAAVCDRDISAVKETRDIANPGSFRRFSISDGIYIGGILNDTPEQYVQFTDAGIVMKSGDDGITLNGLKINKDGQIDGDLPVNGSLKLDGSVENLDGTAYTGIFFGADFRIGSGATLITLKLHQHTANNTPPQPGH